MFQVDRVRNRLRKLECVSFSELGYREREHLQEWLAAMPEALCASMSEGEDGLLIIQKEFDGFDGTRERLDLLALDKQGQLVVIENKLDDSGRDVVWQALKYAADRLMGSGREFRRTCWVHQTAAGISSC
ncbi:hypothetical protein SAMN05421763_11286 [[Luteovulum] sphaeroides subsp. megalophilum]|uniref:hypothetical protein n=1 Tax=Cereibacter sphaeroides TaxID=1063 RepID=UPI000B62B7DC|nr:hypothetical protein [Cereibacter sphaeroides]SNT37492.1 hypothetical protein SAMN05421763_11286 [[Luteovulum] sphaeroides subsp. megalophilum]